MFHVTVKANLIAQLPNQIINGIKKLSNVNVKIIVQVFVRIASI